MAYGLILASSSVYKRRKPNAKSLYFMRTNIRKLYLKQNQHAFSKLSLVNLISKKANLVFDLSVLFDSLFKLTIMTYYRFLCQFKVIDDVI